VDIDLPPEGLPVSAVLTHLAGMSPRAGQTLNALAQGYTLRVVVNGTVVARGVDPWLREGDTVLLLAAMQGG
jgi:molybdopterin converting factor small subunit